MCWVERDEPAEIRRKDNNLQLWARWRDGIAGRQYDIAYEFNDGKDPPENDPEHRILIRINIGFPILILT